jgi:hypothetical protein
MQMVRQRRNEHVMAGTMRENQRRVKRRDSGKIDESV